MLRGYEKHSQRMHSSWWASLLAISFLASSATLAQAEIRLSSDWQSEYQSDGSRVPDDQHEIPRLDKAAKAAAGQRTALSPSSSFRPQLDLSFKLRVDDQLFYLQPAKYMRKSRSDEVCTPDTSKGAMPYACLEGQRHTQDCDLFFFDKEFAEVGFLALRINERYQYFCNTVPAIGVGNRCLLPQARPIGIRFGFQNSFRTLPNWSSGAGSKLSVLAMSRETRQCSLRCSRLSQSAPPGMKKQGQS